jgi:hypothetical protein
VSRTPETKEFLSLAFKFAFFSGVFKCPCTKCFSILLLREKETRIAHRVEGERKQRTSTNRRTLKCANVGNFSAQSVFSAFAHTEDQLSFAKCRPGDNAIEQEHLKFTVGAFSGLQGTIGAVE